jgi:hypothetical protein
VTRTVRGHVQGAPSSLVGELFPGKTVLAAAEKTNTIHEPTRNQHEEDVQFGLFRVISWIVPLVFTDAQQFFGSLLGERE